MTGTYVYWISTSLLSLLYLISATMYIVKKGWARQAIVELGYPAYLVPVLTVAKVLAVIAIVTRANVGLSELAYAGVFYHLLLSAAAHFGVRKPGAAVPALVAIALLIASVATQNVAREKPSPYAPIGMQQRQSSYPMEIHS